MLIPGPHCSWSSGPGCLSLSLILPALDPGYWEPRVRRRVRRRVRGKKSSEGQKILESSFSGWPWTSHFISQNPFCKHGCALPYNLVRRRPELSESTIFFMTGGQGWHRGSTLRDPPVTGRAWLSPWAQTGCWHRQVLPGGLLCRPHPPWEPRPHLLLLS